nr:MAG TPA: hypothetical protein [Caudoviricetes sp.]
MCSYIFKEVKHESLIGELCVFNRHQLGSCISYVQNKRPV